MSRRQRIGLAGLILSALAIVVITMTVAGTDSFHGPLARAMYQIFHPVLMGHTLSEAQADFAANIAMFAPLGFFLGLAVPRGKFLNAVVALPMVSAFVEAVQYFLPTRDTQFEDILANSVGGWIGIGIAWLVVVALGHASKDPRTQDETSSRSY